MSIQKDLSEEPDGYLVIRPDVNDTVTLSEHIPPSSVNSGASFIKATGAQPPSTENFYFGCPLRLATGERVPMAVLPYSDRYLDLTGEMRQGLIYYKHLSTSPTSTIELFAELAPGTQNVRFAWSHRASGTLGWSTNVNQIVAVDATGGADHVFTIPDGLVDHEFRFAINQYDSPTIVERIGVVATGMTFAGGFSRKVFDVWTLLANAFGSRTIKAQYRAAERYSVTAFSALLRNTSAAQYKSGSVVAAQLPGGTEGRIPEDPRLAYQFVASYNDPKTYSGQLNKGVHWFFTPEKVQDWYFQPVDAVSEKPFVVIAWSGVAVNDLANMLGLTLDLKMNIELLTTDISLMKFMPTADLSRLMDLYITLVNSHNAVGENPSHMTRIRKIVGDVLRNPHVRQSLGLMAEAGKTMLPLVLAAL